MRLSLRPLPKKVKGTKILVNKWWKTLETRQIFFKNETFCYLIIVNLKNADYIENSLEKCNLSNCLKKK